MNKIDLIYRSRLYKIFKPFYSGMGHVLMYHRVGSNEEQVFTGDLTVSPGSLEGAIRYFRSRKIDIVSMDECYERITSGSRAKRFVAFTFDDGYEDNLTRALPVFEKYEAPFTLFLATGFPDHEVVLWPYMLEKLVLEKQKVEFHEGDRSFSFGTATMDEKKEAYREIRNYILSSSPENYLPRLTNIFGTGVPELFSLTKKLALSWEQVSDMSRHPLVTIGSHAVSHMALSSLSDDQVLHEINSARSIIESHTGKPVYYMAYPFGMASAVGPREFDMAGRSGLKLAFTTVSSNIMKHHADQLYALPRIEVREGWGEQFLDLYVHGYIPLMHRLVN